MTSERAIIVRLAAHARRSVPDGLHADELVKWFRASLADTAGYVVAVDSRDSIEAGRDRADLNFLSGLRSSSVLVSTTDPKQAALLATGGLRIETVESLPARMVPWVAANIAARWGRTLPLAAVQTLALGHRSPLWLNLVVDERSMLGEDDFRDAIGAHSLDQLIVLTVESKPDDICGVIARVVSRLIATYGGAIVSNLLGLIAISRSGLAPVDLVVMVAHANNLVVAGIRRGFGSMITARGGGGRLAFTHRTVRRAVSDLVGLDAPEVVEGLHLSIAGHLAGVIDSDQYRIEDLLWHRLHVGAGAPAADSLDHLGWDGNELERLTSVLGDALIHGVALTRVCERPNERGLYFFGLAVDGQLDRDANIPRSRFADVVAAALARARDRVCSQPENFAALRNLAILLAVARHRTSAGGARAIADEAVDVCVTWTGLRADRESLRSLAIALANLASESRTGAGRTLYSQYLAIFRYIVARHPTDTDALWDFSTALRNASGAYDTAAAQEMMRESVSVTRRMFAGDPDNGDWRRALAHALVNLGRISTTSAAREFFGEALDIFRDLARADPNDQWTRRDLALALTNLGLVIEPERAAALLRESYEIRDVLIREDPADRFGRRELAATARRLALVERDDSERAALTERSVSIFRELVAEDPVDRNARRGLAFALLSLGPSHSLIDEAQELCRTLLAEDPDDREASRSLSIALCFIADSAAPKVARLLYCEALELRRRISAADPQHLGLRRDVASVLVRLARVSDGGTVGELLGDALQLIGEAWMADSANHSQTWGWINATAALGDWQWGLSQSNSTIESWIAAATIWISAGQLKLMPTELTSQREVGGRFLHSLQTDARERVSSEMIANLEALVSD